MTDNDVVEILLEHSKRQFPKACAKCGRQFATLREYIQETKRIGRTVSFDADLHDWQPAVPLGSLAMSLCPCGTTLALGTDGLSQLIRLRILRWLQSETMRCHQHPSVILDGLRDEIRRRALTEE